MRERRAAARDSPRQRTSLVLSPRYGKRLIAVVFRESCLPARPASALLGTFPSSSESAQVRAAMILCLLFANRAGNVLLERFHGLPAEERLHWRSFLVKLGSENLKDAAREEELFVASHKSVYIVYTLVGDICIYAVGKDPYDELALSEVIHTVVAVVKDACHKAAPSERVFLDKYGKVCLCVDEIVAQGLLEQTDKDRIRRLARLQPLPDS